MRQRYVLDPGSGRDGRYRGAVTEQQPYDVVRVYPGWELRHYPEHLVAQISVRGSFEQAGNIAFGPLVGYIGGANRSRSRIAMTAPVVQGERIAMTAPVVQQSGDAGDYTVAFVLPSSLTEQTAPEPTDPRVQVCVVPARYAAATRYSGRWSQTAYREHCAQLRSAIAGAGLRAIGEPRFARFDPPFKPWFLRRNEVVIDVADPQEAPVREER